MKFKKQKSRLSIRARNINLILFILILILMAGIAGIIINGINKEASMNLVRAYSIEAAETFYSYISQDLTLVQKASHSKAITAWFTNEEDQEKKADAFNEMMDIAAIRTDAHLYLGVQKSFNEYTIQGKPLLEKFIPFDRLNPERNEDRWYFECTGSGNDYVLKTDIEKASRIWRLWINHKVKVDGELAGVFCSGLRVPDIFHDIFGKYEETKIRGYIIDRYGNVQTDSAFSEIYAEEKESHIREESSDPAFAAALASYESRIDGFFGPNSLPEVAKLSQESFGYAAIEPIRNTDWSVVVFYNSKSFSGVKNLLPFLLVMLSALLLYGIVRDAFMNNLIFVPLNRLTQSVSEGKSTDTGFFGSDRDDELGELAWTIHDSSHKQMRQEKLLHAVNSVATVLLAAADKEHIQASLLEGMEIIGRCVDIDRIHIWKNETTDGIFGYINLIHWFNDSRGQLKPTVAMRPYSENPEWERKFLLNECVNGPVSGLTQSEQDILAPEGVKSILVIPLYIQGDFYGFFSFDDCRNSERIFMADEIDLLRSAGLMMVSALNRNIQALQLREAQQHTQVLLDAMPFTCQLWNRDGLLFDCNEAAVKLLETKDKQDYINRFPLLSPEYQSDGQLSSEKAAVFIKKAFDTGSCVFEWMHQSPDGTPIPAEVTLVRVNFGEEPVVAGYARDLREYKQMMGEIERQDLLLKEALKEAQNASSAKSIFLANMSHEMRTPLNAVLGFSELTLETGGLNENVRINLEKIYNAGATLLSTVNDILDISKIEAGKLELVPVEYDVPSLLNDAITQSILRIGEKPIQFNLDINENLPTRLCGDDLRIKQILNNLLSNAFKYTKEGTVELGVDCVQEGDSVLLTARVSDSGRGIRPEDIDSLFTDYAMMDTKVNRKIEGTGLGLPITKKIVEMMGGSIKVESEYGKGSIFTVRIRQKYVSGDVIGAELVKNLKKFRYSDNKRNQNLRLMRIKLPYARVLVVDDVVTNLDVARGMMKPYGMQIDCVTRGQEAIDAIRSEKVRYNAVFMDHMMPEMDGIEAARIIREEIGTEYARTIPIIALTANAIVGNEEMFMSKGFQAFLSKPIEIARLDAVLRQWVRDKTLEEEFITESNEEEGEPDNKTKIPGFPFQVSGIDFQKGIERFGGDKESFLQVLYSYAVNTPPLLETIKKVDRESLAGYAITVHGIKSSSRGISAEVAGSMAEALEKAAKEGNMDFVTANNAAFIEAAETLAGDLGDMLQRMSEEKPKPKKDKPDRDVLDRLAAACEQYNMDAVDIAMTELESFNYESGSELAEWLRENIDQMNFTQIVQKLKEY